MSRYRIEWTPAATWWTFLVIGIAGFRVGMLTADWTYYPLDGAR